MCKKCGHAASCVFVSTSDLLWLKAGQVEGRKVMCVWGIHFNSAPFHEYLENQMVTYLLIALLHMGFNTVIASL